MSQDRFYVDPEISRASTLPAEFYQDKNVFALVQERIFARSWQFVGDTDDLRAPGSVKPVVMLEGCLDEPILITRSMDDQLHMMSNVCTHRAMLVAESPGNERFLRCRYHGRRFGLDGTFQHMPEFEGVCGFPSEADNLPRVPFAQWGKWLFASIYPESPFEDFFSPVLDRLGWLPIQEFIFSASRSRDYLVRANWALYVDNYLEGFHIPFIHSGLNDLLDYGNYSTETFEWGNLQLGVSKDGRDCFDLPSTSPDFGKKISAYYYWIFPNLMLNFYPWGLSINVIKPLSHEQTRVSFLCYVWDESKLGQGAGAELDRVEREDEVVVEAVQRGIRSRLYQGGRFSVARETNTHHFHTLLARALADRNQKD